MRKTAAYIVSILFLFTSGIAILHPSYETLASWLSPLTGGYIYTLFMCFTLLLADPLQYISVGLIWITAGFIIGVISQKKLGASITAFFTWLSMIPTVGISFFGIYQNVEARGIFTIDSAEKIINFIPNIPETLRLTNFLEVPILSEIAVTTMELIPDLNGNVDPIRMLLSVAMPYLIAVALKPVLIIIGAIAGAEISKRVFNLIKLDLLPGKKAWAATVSILIVSQAAYVPVSMGQELDLEALSEMGIDLDALEEMGFDFEALEEIGINLEDLLETGFDPEALSELGLDIDALLDIGGQVPGLGLPLDLSIDTSDGFYFELLGGYVENEGRAITGEMLVGTELDDVPKSESLRQDLAATVILTQKISDPTFLYSLPIEGIEDYVQFTSMIPETVAVNVYIGEDVEAATSKSDQLIEEYELLYGIDFGRIVSQPLTFTGDGESGESMIPPYVVLVYYSLNTFEETIYNLLTGFESKQGFANSFKEKINGDHLDIEIYVTGQITPEHVRAFIPLPDVPVFIQGIVYSLLEKTYHFAAGVQMINEAIPDSSGGTFDLRDTLDINTPTFSSDSDVSIIAVARPNATALDNNAKISTSLTHDSSELMLIEMYFNSILNVEIYGGTTPRPANMRVILPEYTTPMVEVEKTSQLNNNGATVTVTVTNEGSTTLSDLRLKDSFPTKYGILVSGTNEATMTSLTPGNSFSLSYNVEYENPGVYTDLPAILTYEINDVSRSTASNKRPTILLNPNSFCLLSDSYHATFNLIDMLTGKGDLFEMVPLLVIALIAAIDLFKMYKSRFTSEPQAPEEPSLPEPPSDEDTLVDLP